MTECWRDVVGWVGLFRVSDQGRVYDVRAEAVLSPKPQTGGYVVCLRGRGRRQYVLVHRLVLMAFRPTAFHRSFGVKFRNDDKYDVRLDNLEWQPKWPHAKLTEDDVRAIRRRWMAGESGADLSRAFDVSETAIHNVVSGKTYAYVE
jgi:hypothetical protein